jgi:hypothetical protein
MNVCCSRVVSCVLSVVALATLGGCTSLDRYHPLPLGGSKRVENPKGVYLAEHFEQSDWYRQWGLENVPRNLSIVERDPEFGFQPHSGKALRIMIRQGENVGDDKLRYYFAKSRSEQPEEMYLRYYLRFGNDFDTVDGGKMPGFAGTYGEGGWGERRATGTNGWSARGGFEKPDAQNRIQYSFYIYHVNAPSVHGERFRWSERALLKPNRWYCIEEYIKLNAPNRNDGVLRGWVDGELAFEKSDLRFRTTRDLRIEEVWMNVYHGGSATAIHDHHLYIDDVVISEQRIGPGPPPGNLRRPLPQAPNSKKAPQTDDAAPRSSPSAGRKSAGAPAAAPAPSK